MLIPVCIVEKLKQLFKIVNARMFLLNTLLVIS